VERHHAGVRHALRDASLDPLVGPLGLDLGVNSFVLPQILVLNETAVASSRVTLVTRCMNSGQAWNWVH
jgi:hypothetical protein